VPQATLKHLTANGTVSWEKNSFKNGRGRGRVSEIKKIKRMGEGEEEWERTRIKKGGVEEGEGKWERARLKKLKGWERETESEREGEL
jgi:hypothetical protein